MFIVQENGPVHDCYSVKTQFFFKWKPPSLAAGGQKVEFYYTRVYFCG